MFPTHTVELTDYNTRPAISFASSFIVEAVTITFHIVVIRFLLYTLNVPFTFTIMMS